VAQGAAGRYRSYGFYAAKGMRYEYKQHFLKIHGL